MTYRYNCNGKEIKVWLWDDDFHKNVTVNTTKKEIDKPIQTDETGKFFVWDKTKIYLKDYLSYSIEEFSELLEKDEWVTDDDFTQAIIHDGIDKVHFFVPMRPLNGFMGVCFTTSSNPEYFTECYIDESQYKVKDKYKITLRAINPTFGYNHYYICDLLSLIKSGCIFIKRSETDRVEQFWYEQPIGGGFVVKSFATALVD